MTKYNTHNLCGYIFTAVQNSHSEGELHQERGLPFGTLDPEKQGQNSLEWRAGIGLRCLHVYIRLLAPP